jgi:hypothetical protein
VTTERTMDLIVCPHCDTRVVPMSTGQCPACRRGLDDRPDVAPAGPPLHHASPPRPASPPTEAAASLATIRTFEFEPEADLAREYLEEQGVHAFLRDAKTVAMIWILGNAIGYIKLQVPPDQAALARDLLREVRDVKTESEEIEGEGEAVPEDEDWPGTSGVMESLQRLKRPIFWLSLCPPILGAVVAVIAALAWLVQAVVGAVGVTDAIAPIR